MDSAFCLELPTVLRFVYEDRPFRGVTTRREWLRIAGGLGMSSLWPRSARANGGTRIPQGFGKAKSVVLIYASGGQSQIDMWDPKPDAPLDVRGAFSTIDTAVPGLRLCEHLPRLAAIADRYTIVRSMSHEDLDHGSATYLALTGRYHPRLSSNPPPNPLDFPTYGAALKRVQQTGRFPYEAVHINAPALVPTTISPGQDGGFLGRDYEPLVVGDVTANTTSVSGLVPQSDTPTVRLDARRSLKETLDQYAGQLTANQRTTDMNHLYRQALEMLSSPRCREAFDLDREPASLRDRYGRHRSGQACLLARRLVEAGIPWITVVWNHSNRGQDLEPNNTDLYGWDTHNDVFESLKVHLLPRFDEGLATFVQDLDDRGLLNDTLVVCMGEFGRAPRVAVEPKFKGSAPGRKHWSSVYSILMAGAGVRRGAVLGASDRLGAEPITERYGPWDVAATMFSALGIDATAEFLDQLNRPFPLTIGRPIEDLYA